MFAVVVIYKFHDQFNDQYSLIICSESCAPILPACEPRPSVYPRALLRTFVLPIISAIGRPFERKSVPRGSRCEAETQGIVTCASSTMAFNYGASDIVALFTLVVKLYNDVYMPAREAPKTVQELIKELAALKDVLSALADDAKSKIFQQRLGEERKRTLNQCLLNCWETLATLDKLVEKHRNPSGSLWGGIKWVGIKGEVAELKSKISVHSANLTLCLSTIGKYVLRTTFYLE